MSRDIRDLHPNLRRVAEKLIICSKEIGIHVSVITTLRTLKEQRDLYMEGRNGEGEIKTYKKPGDSYHNYGLAFDIECSPIEGFYFIGDEEMYKMVGDIGKKLGLYWGGKSGNVCEMNHFSWSAGLTIEELKKGDLPFETMKDRREYTKRTTAFDVYVRRQPSSVSDVVGVIKKNIPIKVFRITDGWAEIEFLGRRAYLSSKVLK